MTFSSTTTFITMKKIPSGFILTKLKQTFTIAAILLCSNAGAQSSFIAGGFGFGFPAGDRLGTTQPSNAAKNVFGSYGKGLTFGLNTGHMVNENIGLDLGIWYVSGSTYEFTYYNGPNSNSDQLVSGHTLRIMPCVKVTGGKLNKPYAKFGFILGIATELNNDETFTSGGGNIDYNNYEFKSGSATGWAGAFGIDFSQNQTTSIFLEINFCHQIFKPGLETINSASQAPQTFNLVDEPNPSDPNQKLRPAFPFSTVGITAGVRFSSFLNKKDSGGNSH